MILSLHPVIQGDVNRIIAGRPPSQEDIKLMKKARAIVLSQGVTREVYELAKAHCRHVFPNYDVRFAYPGKTGQARLFKKLELPHPKTMIFEEVADFLQRDPEDILPFPYVIKCSQGGEGREVFMIQDQSSLAPVLELLQSMERAGVKGFVVQEFVPNDHRDLRAVIMGSEVYTYWKSRSRDREFLHNLSAGAEVDTCSDPQRMARGKELAQAFSRLCGANLAALDLIFPRGSHDPLLLEVNYFFGRRGLGGSFNYYRLLQRAVNQWLRQIGEQP